MTSTRRISFSLIVLALIAAIGFYAYSQMRKNRQPEISPPPADTSGAPQAAPSDPGITGPLADWQERVTKKPFGIFVSPGRSPVDPERFRGYHTGTDFEILAGEGNAEVAVNAICSGKILRKETARGYGGLLTQACTIDGQAVTVYYGHIKIASVGQAAGTELKEGRPFAILGQGFSAETGGERKHLHLGIHKGPGIDNRGYVQNQSELKNWLDFRAVIPQ